MQLIDTKDKNVFTCAHVRTTLLSPENVKAFEMTPDEAYDAMASAMGSIMTCLVELIDSRMRDCVYQIRQRKKKYYRHELKKAINESLKAIEQNCTNVKLFLSRKTWNLYLSYVDAYNEYITEDVMKMHWAVRNSLTKNGASSDDAELYANCETLRMILFLANELWKQIVADGRRRSLMNFSVSFSEYQPIRAFKTWQTVCDILYKITPFRADLRHNKDIQLSYDILWGRVCNGSYLAEAARDSLNENTDMLSDDEREELNYINKQVVG